MKKVSVIIFLLLMNTFIFAQEKLSIQKDPFTHEVSTGASDSLIFKNGRDTIASFGFSYEEGKYNFMIKVDVHHYIGIPNKEYYIDFYKESILETIPMRAKIGENIYEWKYSTTFARAYAGTLFPTIVSMHKDKDISQLEAIQFQYYNKVGLKNFLISFIPEQSKQLQANFEALQNLVNNKK